MLFPIETKSFSSMHPELRAQCDTILASAVASDQPVYIQMLANVGSGKTTFTDRLSDLWPNPKPTLLGFDRIMNSLPSYQLAVQEDEQEAFEAWEAPAREAGYITLNRLLDRRTNIIFDHSGAQEDHINLIRRAKRIGYRTVVVHIACNQDIASQRILDRLQNGETRYTPSHYLIERGKIIENLLPQYQQNCDSFYSVENNFGTKEEFIRAIQKLCLDILVASIVQRKSKSEIRPPATKNQL